MSDITYRPMKKEEFDTCLEVVYGAFKDYSVYHIFDLGSDDQLQNFNRSIMYLQLYEAMVKDTVMVAERENDIVCVAMIQDPNHKEPSIPRYFLYGAFSVFRYGGIKTTLGFLDMMDHCNAPRLEYAKTNPCWNLECIAVKSDCIGQGLGSRMINECVVPLVKEKGGERLTLITNAEKNTFFYKKNGFKLLQQDEFTYNNKRVDNWSFLREIN